MSAAWSHGPRPPTNSGPRSGTNPPPVCFNCGQEGHYVVACPQPSRLNSGSFPLPPAGQQHSGAAPSPQGYQGGLPNGQYIPSNQPPPYGPPASYPYAQPLPLQSYGPSPNSGQYGPGSQAQPYNQYTPQQDMPQYRPPSFQAPLQQYGSPVNTLYQPPPNNFIPPDSTYNGSYGAAPLSQYPPPHWNNPHPAPNSTSSYQRQHRTSSQGFRRETSGTPSQKSYQNTPRHEHGSGFGDHRAAQQQHASRSENKLSPSHVLQGSPNVGVDDSKSPSYAATLSGRHDAIDVAGPNQSKNGPNDSELRKDSKITLDSESEIREIENEEHQFNWDLKYIFKEPQKAESVALAQPLSTTFDMTPVPQIDSKSTRSVSRYARNENLKEFTRSIRAAPQWSYLQEDPAFSDVALDGPLVPVSEIPAWIEKRQGIMQVASPDTIPEPSRKRNWSEEQEELTITPVREAHDEVDVSRAVKRQKNEAVGESDENMTDKGMADSLAPSSCQTPVNGTPVFARLGTPCLADVDDAWAPEPGEGATSPGDPTEALLASLGVTGSPKPVAEEPPQSYEPSDAIPPNIRGRELSRPQGLLSSSSSLTSTNPVEDVRTDVAAEHRASGPMHANYSDPKAATHSGFQHESQRVPQNSGFPNGQRDRNYNNRSYSNGNAAALSNHPPAGPPRSTSWSDGAPRNTPYATSPHGSPPQYGPPMNSHYQTGNQSGYPSAPPNTHANPQWGALRSSSYPNPQYHSPQYDNGSRPLVQQGPAQQYGTGPPQAGYPDGQSQYSIETTPGFQYGPSQYANPHYNNGTPQDPSQPIDRHQQRYGRPPAGPFYANAHVPHGNQSHVPQSVPQYTREPERHEQQHGNVPPRQDSGYMSAGGPNTNGPEDTGFFPNHRSAQNGNQYIADNKRKDNQHPQSQEASAKASPQAEHIHQRSSTPEEPGTPLSPTSAEILGKLVGVPSPSKKGEASRQADDGVVRKPKRPQPVVAEAYSRRW